MKLEEIKKVLFESAGDMDSGDLREISKIALEYADDIDNGPTVEADKKLNQLKDDSDSIPRDPNPTVKIGNCNMNNKSTIIT